MPKTQEASKLSELRSLMAKSEDMMNEWRNKRPKKEQPSKRAHYTPEEQWEIAKKYGIAITPSMPKKPTPPK